MKKSIRIILLILLVNAGSQCWSMMGEHPVFRLFTWPTATAFVCTAMATGANSYCIARNAAYYFDITDQMGMTCGLMPGDLLERVVYHGLIEIGLIGGAVKLCKYIARRANQ